MVLPFASFPSAVYSVKERHIYIDVNTNERIQAELLQSGHEINAAFMEKIKDYFLLAEPGSDWLACMDATSGSGKA